MKFSHFGHLVVSNVEGMYFICCLVNIEVDYAKARGVTTTIQKVKCVALCEKL